MKATYSGHRASPNGQTWAYLTSLNFCLSLKRLVKVILDYQGNHTLRAVDIMGTCPVDIEGPSKGYLSPCSLDFLASCIHNCYNRLCIPRRQTQLNYDKKLCFLYVSWEIFISLFHHWNLTFLSEWLSGFSSPLCLLGLLPPSGPAWWLYDTALVSFLYLDR